ncbi:hypothetical protein L0657_08820 [Dyadobacter sp. CY345]|nr:hypothetical protein [Dyadobacter sp. CY345]
MQTGSAEIHQALLKVENVFQKSGTKNIRQSNEESDFSVYASFILENTVLLEKLSRISKMPETFQKSFPVNETNTKRFLKILFRVAKGNEGVSRQDRIFLCQFWYAFQKF